MWLLWAIIIEFKIVPALLQTLLPRLITVHRSPFGSNIDPKSNTSRALHEQDDELASDTHLPRFPHVQSAPPATSSRYLT